MKRAGIALIAVVTLFVIVMTAPDPFGPIGPPIDRLLPPDSDWVFWTDRVEEIPAQSATLRHHLAPLSTLQKTSSRQADSLLHVLSILSSFRDRPLISGEIALAGALAGESAESVSAPLVGVDRRSPSRIAWFLALWRPGGVALRRALRLLTSGKFFDRYVRDLLPPDWGVSVDGGILEIADPEALWTRTPPVTGIRPPDNLFITVIRDLVVVSTDRRRVREVIEKVNGETPSKSSRSPLPDPPVDGAVVWLAPTARHAAYEELDLLGVGLPLTFLGGLLFEPDAVSALEIRWHGHGKPKMLTVAFPGRAGLRAVPRELPDAELSVNFGVSTEVFDEVVGSTFGPDAGSALGWQQRAGSVVTLAGEWEDGSPRWTAKGRPGTPREMDKNPIDVLIARWRRPVGDLRGEGAALAALLPETLHARGLQDACGRIILFISAEQSATP